MIYVNSITVYPSSITIRKGEWYYGASATVCPTNADCKNVEWISGNTSVASVNPTTGYIYGVNVGTTRVCACATDGSGESDYITVTVTNGPIYVSSVSLNRTSLTLEKGKTFTLTETVCPTNATNKTIDWSSENNSVATVNNGVVTAKGKGSTYIYACTNDGSGEYARCYVTVTENVLATSVTASWDHAGEVFEKTIALTQVAVARATVCPPDTTNKKVEWTSKDPEIATVNPSSGLVMAQKLGTAVIRATATDGSEEYGECTLHIVEPILAESITICQREMTLCIGDTERLEAIVYPQNATDKRVRWCSSDEDVVVVDEYTGCVTAVSKGIATIRASTVDGCIESFINIKVNIERVTIKKDGGYNKVFFHSSGKVWHCIGCDVIFDEENKYNSELTERSNYNYFATYKGNQNVDNSEIIIYTNDELRLLYAIDPCGVANYINRYAEDSQNYPESEDDVDSLQESLKIKDEKFEVLFGRAPRYYYVAQDGRWIVARGEPDIQTQLSESEAYFGMLVRADGLRVLVNLISFAESIVCAICTIDALDYIFEGVGLILKVAIFLFNEEYSLALQEIKDKIIENTQNVGASQIELIQAVSPVFDVLEVADSFVELTASLGSKPKYFQATIDYCVTKVDYDVTLELASGERCKLEKIHQAIIEESM